MKTRARLVLLIFSLLVLSACGIQLNNVTPASTNNSPKPVSTQASNNTLSPNVASGIHKIQHIIIIMQENRSFDQYFGTYPNADGIPMQNGVPTVCVNDPKTNQCVKPYHNPTDVNAGGPHAAASASADIHGSQMNGFIAQSVSYTHLTLPTIYSV